MTKFLTGYGVPPVIVGIARGALIAGAIAIVEALISTLTSASLPASPWLIAAPFIVAALRGAEGALDGLQKPAAPPATPTSTTLPNSVTDGTLSTGSTITIDGGSTSTGTTSTNPPA